MTLALEPQPTPLPAPQPAPPYDLAAVRAEFPILSRVVHGKPLVYLDNSASTQKPRAVLAAITGCYEEFYSNVHRGVHELSMRSTQAHEAARARIARFLNAPSSDEVVFVRGTTEALNLVAWSYGRTVVGAGDRVVVTALEHHSNLVPWQLLCEERGAELAVAPIDDRGELILPELERLLDEPGRPVRIVAAAHVSNALGTVLPIRLLADLAHRAGAVLVVDGAQSAPHMVVDVQALGCDFFAFSGHKVYGPSGIGALWGRTELLAGMPPWQGGGGMIAAVRYTGTTFAPPPQRFEAGTPAIEAALGLAAALDFMDEVGRERVAAWEGELLARATELLAEIPGLRLVGTARDKAAVVSFVLDGAHPHDVATILDGEGIAVRAGHHCAQPLMGRLGVPALTRASFGLYNTLEEVEVLAAGLRRVRQVLLGDS